MPVQLVGAVTEPTAPQASVLGRSSTTRPPATGVDLASAAVSFRPIVAQSPLTSCSSFARPRSRIWRRFPKRAPHSLRSDGPPRRHRCWLIDSNRCRRRKHTSGCGKPCAAASAERTSAGSSTRHPAASEHPGRVRGDAAGSRRGKRRSLVLRVSVRSFQHRPPQWRGRAPRGQRIHQRSVASAISACRRIRCSVDANPSSCGRSPADCRICFLRADPSPDAGGCRSRPVGSGMACADWLPGRTSSRRSWDCHLQPPLHEYGLQDRLQPALFEDACQLGILGRCRRPGKTTPRVLPS